MPVWKNALAALCCLLLVFLLPTARLATTSANPLAQVPTPEKAKNTRFLIRLVEAARQRTRKHVTYDGRYISIPYPMGDVPDNIGVCTDVIIRAYRTLNIDLQERVHRDMKRAFARYPKRWGLKRPDSNIDHRRVPNLQTFFTRHGQKLKISSNPKDYRPGDLVTWKLAGRLPHIGIVSDRKAADGKTPLIIHNIGAGPVEDNILFAYPVTGRYRYIP